MPSKLYTISHYRSGCIGCGACETEASQNWILDEEDGLSTLKQGKNKRGTWVATIDEFDYPDNLRAAQNCPVNVIRITGKK
jgi:ferredoxin